MSTSAPFSPYHLGKTASFACRTDQRFSYCLYVPPNYAKASIPARILVTVHGSERTNQSLRDFFCDFAEATNTIVLSPLFPCGIKVADDVDNYKYLEFHGIRFDEIVIAMVNEVTERYAIDGSKFLLFGFSGGAQFAHRFFYVHPNRLHAVVVGAPGSVTLPVSTYRWWAGLQDYSQLFGRPIPWDLLRKVPIHLIVGRKDTNTAGTVQSRDQPNWVEGANAAGSARVERLRTLYTQLLHCEMQVTFEELDGVRHEVEPIASAAIRYFQRSLGPCQGSPEIGPPNCSAAGF